MSCLSVQVPGKIMLAGEYAVLRGAPCLATAIDVRMSVTVQPAKNDWLVYSDFWDETWSLDNVPLGYESNALIQTLRWCRENWQLPPFSLRLQSEFVVTDGFGSSSALRLGVLVALKHLFLEQVLNATNHENWSNDPWLLPRYAWQMQLRDQSFSSGYDVMTQYLGGWVQFQANQKNWPGEPRQLHVPARTPNHDYLHIFRGGAGAPTKSVGGQTQKWLDQNNLWPALIDQSTQVVNTFGQTLLQAEPDLSELISQVSQIQKLFADSPHHPHDIQTALQIIPGFDRTWTYKTTGAGGEDAILMIGRAQDLTAAFSRMEELGWSKLPFEMGASGLKVMAMDQQDSRNNQETFA